MPWKTEFPSSSRSRDYDGYYTQKNSLPENTDLNQIEKSSNKHSSGSSGDSNNKDERKIGRKKNLQPDPNANGPHTVYKRDPMTGKITKYESYQPQTNPNDPKPWESLKRYDGPPSGSHYNKFLDKYINSPHVHDPSYPGGIRPAMPWEIP